MIKTLTPYFSTFLIMTTSALFGLSTAEAAKDDFFPDRPVLSNASTNGVGYPAFNIYVDSAPWAYHIGEVDNPKDQTGNPRYYDERDFLVGRKCSNENCSFSRYFHTVSDKVSVGDSIIIKMLIHNGAESNKGLKATNTVVRIDWSTPQATKATITSKQTKPISDIVSFPDISKSNTFKLTKVIEVHNGSGKETQIPLNGRRVLSYHDTSLSIKIGDVLAEYKDARTVAFFFTVIGK